MTVESADIPIPPRRRRRWNCRIKAGQAENAIYIDFEGTRSDPACMVGAIYRNGDEWEMTQWAFDPALQFAATSTGHGKTADLDSFVEWLQNVSEDRRAHVISWSEHDINVLLQHKPGLSLRFRSARSTAAIWSKQLNLNIPGVLQSHLDYIGFERDPRIASGAVGWIQTIRERLQHKSDWEDVSPGCKRTWRRLVDHNATDLMGMNAVIQTPVKDHGTQR